MADLGAPLTADGLKAEDFASSIIYQIGRPPLRIDIISEISGVFFAEAWRRRKREQIAGIDIHFISLEDLIRNKEASGRPSDVEHLKLLKKQTKPRHRPKNK